MLKYLSNNEQWVLIYTTHYCSKCKIFYNILFSLFPNKNKIYRLSFFISLHHSSLLSISTNLYFPPLKPILSLLLATDLSLSSLSVASLLSWLDQKSHALFGSGSGDFMGLNRWVWFELLAELVDGFELAFLGFVSTVAKSVD